MVQAILLLLVTGCNEDSSNNSATPNNISSGDDPNFTIVEHNDLGFTETNRKVVVFGISIYAYANVEDEKLLHAANIMAQYLDNDEDGSVDNQVLLDELTLNNAKLYLWKTEDQTNLEAQDLGADETVPAWHDNGHVGEFDASLEEVWHVITHTGYANAYPAIFGEDTGTNLSIAMDAARKGQFITIPSSYPLGAWYTYDDATCDYNCMVTEYFYWGMMSILGAQENRLAEVEQEWDLNTRALVQTTDTDLYDLLTDVQYKLPTVLPDGTYKR